MKFSGMNSLITGGASGIGAATALKFAREGVRVIVADNNVAKGLQVITQIKEMGAEGFFVEVDLADEASIRGCCEQVAQKITVLHALVNNAGIIRLGGIENYDSRGWEPQVSVNLLSAVWMTKGLLPLLKKEGGAIVNLSSEGAFRAQPNRWVYDVTKAGMGVLTRSMAAEFKLYGIRVNTVAPGWIVTEMHYADTPDPEKRKKELETMQFESCLLQRLGRPEEVAKAIFFLCSDEASYITATTLHVDGGLTTM